MYFLGFIKLNLHLNSVHSAEKKKKKALNKEWFHLSYKCETTGLCQVHKLKGSNEMKYNSA